MSDEQIINELNRLNTLCEGDGVYVKFNRGAGMDPLKDIITDAIRNWRKKDKSISDANKAAEETKDAIQEVRKEVKITNTELKAENGTLDQIADTSKKSVKEQAKAEKERGATAIKALKYLRYAKDVADITKKILGKVVEDAKKRIDWVAELQENGVHLVEGFDESFHDLADISGKTHDDFVKMMVANSRFITKMNTAGVNGARQIATAAGQVVGRWGVTGKEADAIIKDYVEGLTEFDNIDSLRRKNLAVETEKATKMIKGLSAATGKSVEQIIQENKLKEKNFLHKRLATDEKTRNTYATMKAMGKSDAEIEYALLGKVSKETALLGANKYGNQYLKELRDFGKNSMGKSSEDVIKNAEALYKGSYQKMVANRKNVNLDRFAYLNWDSDFAKALLGTETGPIDFEAMKKQLNNNNPETAAVNSMVRAEKSANKISNEIEDSTLPSLTKATTIMNGFSDAVGVATEGLKMLPDWLKIAASQTANAANAILSSSLGSTAATLIGMKALGMSGAAAAGTAGATGAGAAGAGAGAAGAAGAGAAATAGLVLAGTAAFAAGGYVGYKGVEYIDEKVSASDKKDIGMYESLKQRYINGEELSSDEMEILKNGVKIGWWGFRSTYGGEKLFPHLEKLRKQKIDKMNNSNNIGPAAQTPAPATTDAATKTSSETVVSETNNASTNKLTDRKEEYLEEITRIVKDVLTEMKTAPRKPITNMI